MEMDVLLNVLEFRRGAADQLRGDSMAVATV